MSALVKLSSALPGEDETNGLDCLAGDLVTALDTDGAVLALVVFDVSDVTRKAGGESVPRVRVRKAEAVGWIGEPVGNLPPVAEELRNAYLERSETRRGMKPLPLETLDADDAGFEILT